MKISIIYEGDKFRICGITNGEHCYVQEFINGLEKTEQKKIIQLLKRTADHGTPGNEEKFHKFEKVDIWEFKSFQVRLFCFFGKGHQIILTHGFKKKSSGTPKEQIDKALRFKKEYLESEEARRNEH